MILCDTESKNGGGAAGDGFDLTSPLCPLLILLRK